MPANSVIEKWFTFQESWRAVSALRLRERLHLLGHKTLSYQKRGGIVPTGKVKSFNQAAEYGFIQPDDGDKPLFVSLASVQAAGLSDLSVGQKISYEIVRLPGKYVAENLRIEDEGGSS